ncbi:MAG: ribbon-helix-helix protein, CopG family [Deltaproteobacteria bacterium]|nr:ribbon-helix-helix protein, CopG family [Deltaproteobacteria bacterium]
METTSIRLPESLARAVARVAARRGLARSTIVRKALEDYLRRTGEESARGLGALVDALVDYPGSGVGDLGARGEDHLRRRFRGRRARPR